MVRRRRPAPAPNIRWRKPVTTQKGTRWPPPSSRQIDRLHPVKLRGELESYGVQELLLFTDNGKVVLTIVGNQGTLSIPMPEATAIWLMENIEDTLDELAEAT
jgi:hypothetical protein